MAATDTLLARAEPWLRANIRDGLRVLLPLPVLALSWWFVRLSFDRISAIGLIIYAAFNLFLLVALRYARSGHHERRVTTLLLASVLGDVFLAIWLLLSVGPFTLSIFPIYTVLGMKAIHYRRRFLSVILVPALLGPLYLSATYIVGRGIDGLSTEQALAYWGLVGGSCLFVILLLILGERRLRQANELHAQMAQLRADHDSRVAELDSINTDLRVRIRRQQSLEESLRAITGSLSLDDVLSQILDSMMQMLGTPRVSAAGLTLVSGAGFTHRTIGLDGVEPSCWAEPLAQRVVSTRGPVVVGDALLDRDWREVQRCGAMSALSVPLIDPAGQVLGALTVVSTQRHAFTPTEARHLTSFSIQASVAIHNAELHTRLGRQQAMLQAVLRDIGDGLIVVDVQGAMVMANPVAYQALQQSDSLGGNLRDALDQITRDLRDEGVPMIEHELQFGEDDYERAYQIFASLVRTADDDESYVAIILRDITDHKQQERQRVEFISMVSHELRNPLNTLNGFLKVVLQGKAGPLNELQQEFLGLADNQADALKGRITELLEFNRLEAGRLRLQPQWANLTDLLLNASARFQIQAEQFELSVDADVPDTIPELLIDSGRIGQVVTNLIENAMKATPAGGHIRLSAQVREQEVLVQVVDTGVGIAPDQREKIFSRFYRLEHNSSKHGVHLGLGLSICQQIIEGHNGRIWVDSELGKGSSFNFTIPLVRREQLISEPVAP
ncbi:GAF domain-containing protein [Oscillochloris sp. ZM17-4]|uniref:ATP-binding protein n=1 Tax=Oscillochloris sp. ZM17-4 TaxID=2866714 RepID=UPI001C738109|nr:ATP-binding protein [Oscillochloris sp. ZM17-4]MBX0330108.1 GAF domain-containing protein [Oscillochloris sp. ZM17-4]